MKITGRLAICFSCFFSCFGFADLQKDFTMEMAHQLLGISIERLDDVGDFTVTEHPSWVDEEVIIRTEKWLLSYPDGSSLVAYTDDGVVTRLNIMTADWSTDRGVRVGDRLRHVIDAYPEATFADGSNDNVTTSALLFVEDGDMRFHFHNPELRTMLAEGRTIPVDDSLVADLKLSWISVSDANNYACFEEFPCLSFPARYYGPETLEQLAREREAYRNFQERLVKERRLVQGTFADPLGSGGYGPEMVVLPAGRFRMGCVPEEIGCRAGGFPPHEETIPEPIAMSRHEVTFAQWDECQAAGGCGDRRPKAPWGGGRQPVIDVTWQDAQSYVRWLSQETGKQYRLPTESEWEYAARAGASSKYSWGDSIGRNLANCARCGSAWDGRQPAPVASFTANAFGLYDMHGNVDEWVSDCWRYEGGAADGRARLGEECGQHVTRGGSWRSDPQYIHAASRWGRSEIYGYSTGAGFRVARTLEP